MKPERWQKLDSLFHSALSRPSTERLEFLNEACAGDEELRQQLEALLAAHEKAGGFIESPALELAARGLAADQNNARTAMVAGEAISHYRIISPLGSGGMGEVYLAQDTFLSRQVALKVLPEYFATDRDRLRRFQQEARTVSALNHPNIITIFEMGEFAGRQFIVTEFIDGTTLRDELTLEQQSTSGTLLKLREKLDIAIQTADALAAAHEANIIHRDIKPENIMLRRRDGYVKVLDFGLAKLSEGAAVEIEAPTRIQTSAGIVMGTATYMSPEQARGENVDERTDIWSVGVVLYEMVAGCVPFDRSTPSEVIALILEREPPPLARYVAAPTELERIVNKALTKDREARYQTAKDLLADLRLLRQRLDVEGEIESTSQSLEERGRQIALGNDQTATATARARRETGPAAHTTLIAEGLVPFVNRHKYKWAILAGFLAVMLAAIAYGVVTLIGQRKGLPPLRSGKPVRLTTTGKATRVAISPDGKWVVHVMNDGGKRSLWTRQVATHSKVEIVAPAVVTYHSLTFSPDGNYIYYSMSSKEAPQLTLYQVPTLGGAPKKLLDDLDGDIDHASSATVSFSPDGKQIAFLRKGEGKETGLTIANADGSSERKVTTYQPHEGIGFPTWSPDGHRIAYAVLNYDKNEMTVVEAQVGDGASKPLTSQKWLRIFGLAWLSDGSGLLMIAGRDQFVAQIWQLSYPGGEVHQLTNDLNDYVGMSLATNTDTLAVIKMAKQASVWIAPDNDATRARPVTSGSEKADDQVAFSPDGDKIVFRSNASGYSDIWIVNADGSNLRQLTANARTNVGPAVSPDGRHILFLSDRSGVPHIWKMNIDGSDQQQLTNGNGEELPRFSPDGRSVVYSTISEKSTVWKVSADGGEPVQLTDKLSIAPTVSPDGMLVACLYKDEKAPWQIAIIPIDGGRPIKTLGYGVAFSKLHWMPDGRAIAYVDPRDGVSNIVAQPVDGGAPKKLTDFKTDRIFSFDWSRDGRQLALARGTQGSDVILIKYSR